MKNTVRRYLNIMIIKTGQNNDQIATVLPYQLLSGSLPEGDTVPEVDI